ncbi:MAG TPA: hypothetical protein VK211_11345 [Kamptonema sp.]|nr:hypothetical protein [Kamptonema sp.]
MGNLTIDKNSLILYVAYSRADEQFGFHTISRDRGWREATPATTSYNYVKIN